MLSMRKRILNEMEGKSMARMESKSVRVAPAAEQSTIDRYQKFGWVLLGSQEVFNRDSHLEEGAPGTINSVTETTHFVKLVFQRDMDMPYYNKIKELDEQFEVTLDELDSSKRLRRRSLLWSIPLGFLVTAWIGSIEDSIVVFIAGLIGGACVIAGGIYLRKRATKQCDELTAKRDEILTAIARYV